MLPNMSRSTQRRFLTAEQGAAYPVFDLSGQQQRAQALRRLLTEASDALASALGRELRQMLSCDSLRVTCQDWQTTVPELAEFRLLAFTPDQCDEPALLGLSRRSLFSLTEVFFGGQPQKLTDKQIEQRSLSDTERRLCNRMLNLFLKQICGRMNLPLADWQSNWLEPGAAASHNAFWCPMTVAGEAWSVDLHFAWPQAKACPIPPADQGGTGEFKARMENRLKRVATTLKVEVASLNLNLAALGELRAGQILPLDLSGEINVRAGDTDCLKGVVCEDGDRLALRITKVVGEHR